MDDVKYIVDENLLGLGNGMVAVRGDIARFSRAPVDELPTRGPAALNRSATSRWVVLSASYCRFSCVHPPNHVVANVLPASFMNSLCTDT
jgi:hypothetical protein